MQVALARNIGAGGGMPKSKGLQPISGAPLGLYTSQAQPFVVAGG